MKVLFLIFCLGCLDNFILGQDVPQRIYPKKVDSHIHKNLKLYNRKYFKESLKNVDKAGLPVYTKKQSANPFYTVFPPHMEKVDKLAPPSPSSYFPSDGFDIKSAPKYRVKKVLGEGYFTENKRLPLKGIDAKNPPKPGSQFFDQDILSGLRRKRSPEKEIDAKNPPKPKSLREEFEEEQPKGGLRRKRSPEKEVDAKNPPKPKSLQENLEAIPESGLRRKRSPEKEIDTSNRTNPTREKLAAAQPNKNAKITDKSKDTSKKEKSRKNIPKKEPLKNTRSKHDKSVKPKRKNNSKTKQYQGLKELMSRKSKNSNKKNKKAKRRMKKDGRRLIAARDALIEDYPYVVSIQKDGEHWCAGALLNPRLVITTANCVWKANRMSRLKVRAGSRYATEGGQVARVAELMKHPGWSIRKNPNYDVALLSLERNIRFDHSVHAVDLPNRVMMPAFSDAWVTSWGSERRDGVYEKREMTLQVYHASLMERQKCTNITQRFGVVVTENFICLTQNGRRAPCTRDTGAPAVSDGVLWGLASWGIRKLCGTERFPAMFSYIASPRIMDFISNATTYLMSEMRENPYPGRLEISHDKLKVRAPQRRLRSLKLANRNRAGPRGRRLGYKNILL